MSQSMRAGLVAFLLACGPSSVAWADVIYVRPNAASFPAELVEDLRAAGADLTVYEPPGRTPPERWWVVRGRVREVRNETPLAFVVQPCRTVRSRSGGPPRIIWLRGRSFRLSLADVARIDHEIDHVQDLRWMLSNRDVLLWKSKQPTERSNPYTLGYEPFNSYFRAAAGIPGQRFPRGYSFPLPEQVDAGGVFYRLQEGWLVEWLRLYRRKNSAAGGGAPGARAEPTVEDRMDRVGRFFERVRRAGGGLPSEIDPALLETDPLVAVASLLRTAALDRRYMKELPGPGGRAQVVDLFGFGFERDPRTGQPRAKFATVCKRVVRLLCDLALEADPAARALGQRAREAVLRVLEEAAPGRGDGGVSSASAPAPPADAEAAARQARAELALRLRKAYRNAYRVGLVERNPAVARRLIADARRLARELRGADPHGATAPRVLSLLDDLEGKLGSVRPAPRPSTRSQPVAPILADFPVDPTEMAIIALEVILESPSWQVPQRDELDVEAQPLRAARSALEPGERLTRAVLELAREAPPGSPRTNDRPRRNRATVQVGGARVEVSELEHGVRETLKHLLRDDSSRRRGDAELFRRHVAELLTEGLVSESAVAEEGGAPPPASGTSPMHRIAAEALAESGYAGLPVMQETVERLFALAQIDPQGGRRSALNRFRAKLQRDAAATILLLAAPDSGRDDAFRRQRKEAIARMVLERLDERAQALEKGFAGDGELRLFATLRGMVTGSGPREVRDRAAASDVEPDALRARFVRSYRKHLEDLRRSVGGADPERLRRLGDAVLERILGSARRGER